MNSDQNVANSSSIEFMLKEYDRINELWIDENSQAERRVNFFLSIASATVGAIFLIFQLGTLSAEIQRIAVLGILVLFFFFGMTILNRLNTRTVQLRALRNSQHEIQDYFSKRDACIKEYFEKQKSIYFVPRHKCFIMRFIHSSFSGGLDDLMIYCNSFILGGIVLILLLGFGLDKIIIILAFIVTVLIAHKLFKVYCNFMVKSLRPWLIYKIL